MRRRLAEFPLDLQHRPQVAVRFRIVRVETQRLFEASLRILDATHLNVLQGQSIVCGRIARVVANLHFRARDIRGERSLIVVARENRCVLSPAGNDFHPERAHFVGRVLAPADPPSRTWASRIGLGVVVREAHAECRAPGQHQRILEAILILPTDIPLLDPQQRLFRAVRQCRAASHLTSQVVRVRIDADSRDVNRQYIPAHRNGGGRYTLQRP